MSVSLGDLYLDGSKIECDHGADPGIPQEPLQQIIDQKTLSQERQRSLLVGCVVTSSRHSFSWAPPGTPRDGIVS